MSKLTVFPFFRSGSPFSNWYADPLSGQDYQFQINGVKYVCSEQYMMAEKARLFKDDYNLNRIMSTKSPREHKRMGRLVNNFNPKTWDANCQQIVRTGLIAKFSQHSGAQKALLNTGDMIICEASPYDKIWGVGMADTHPDIQDPSKWHGTNYLGKILMEVRTILKQAAKDQKVKDQKAKDLSQK